MNQNKDDKKIFGEMFNQINSDFNRCFWPESSCSSKAIRAHSIQNKVILDLICEHNHVIMPQSKLNIDTGPSIEFKLVGRNKATTFTGLCDDHDSKLFDPIDNNEFEQKNHEHLFLLAYRSVLRELHSKMKAAVDIQKLYSRGVELGKFNPELSDQPMMMATIAMIESYSFYRYKFSYDAIYRLKEYYEIEHKIEFIDNLSPSLAVSATYSHIDNMKVCDNRMDPKCTVLNVFPNNNGIYVIFSYRKDHRSIVLPHIERIFQAERNYKLYLISKLILMYCENFVMSPKFYRNFTEDKKRDILSFFSDNIAVNKKDKDNYAFYLFD